MNLYEYLPSLLAIYLILISNFAAKYLRSNVERFIAGDPHLTNIREFIANVALDWADRLGFFSSMSMALISVFSIFSNSRNYGLAVGMVLILLLILFPMLFWIFSLNPGDMVATRVPRLFNKTPSTICNFTLIGVNIILIIAILISQLTALSSQNSPVAP